ncbi:MAG: TrkH family potassium uptake protein [Firmicutes bacterium]|nr:TrkH family potassium uptake protein [Bacillota bacterium]
MDFGVVSRVLALLLAVEAGAMVPPLALSAYRGEGDMAAFLFSIALTLLMAAAVYALSPKEGSIRYREGFMIVGIGWILISIFGALPFVLYGTFNSFVDGFFEAASGFSTTGATVLQNIEGQPHGILLWRAMTHWLGGMGILVLVLALLPALGVGGFQIFKTESPGPMPGKLVARVGATARILYTTYLLFTLVQIFALKWVGMSWFDSITHTFATMGTGGFSTKSASVGAFQNAGAEWLISGFMLLASVNFSLYYGLIKMGWRTLVKDSELKLFVAIVALSTLVVTVDVRHLFDSAWEALRTAAFQVASIISTTGFATADYQNWPGLSQGIIFSLIFIGACAGSTGGGIKVIRVAVLFKYMKRSLYKLIHPQAVIPLRVAGSPIPEETVHSILGFLVMYIGVFAVVTLVLLTQGLDLVTSSSAAATSLSNVGPGFGMVGPAFTYTDLTALSKLVLAFAMILGRLELHTMLVMLVPAFWRE